MVGQQKSRRDKIDAKYAEMTLPSSGVCVVTDTTARMNVEYFEQLLEYSTSIPTGKFVGKRWKCRRREGGWWLVEYVEDPDPNMVGIKYRRVMAVVE